jgi:tryptophan synthase alpha chain
MSKIDERFAQLKPTGRRAFMPFITAGDPSLKFTEKMLLALDSVGCDLFELGIPYSDPIADGPVIQESYTRSLNAGTKLKSIFEMLGRVTPQLKAPVVTMISYAIIHRLGPDRFLSEALSAGVAGAIVPDLPADESEEFAQKCRQLDFSLIQLVTPTTHPQRAVEIVKLSSGFVYYVSVAGITGERLDLPAELASNIRLLKQNTNLPICVGFGISQPAHIERLKQVADGFIVGSAIVKKIGLASSGSSEAQVIADVKTFAQQMLQACK